MKDFVEERMLEKYAKKYVPEILKEMNVELLAIKQTGRGVAVIYYLPEEQEIIIEGIPCPLAFGHGDKVNDEEFMRRWIDSTGSSVRLFVSKHGVIWIRGTHACETQLDEVAEVSWLPYLLYKIKKEIKKLYYMIRYRIRDKYFLRILTR